MSPLDAEHDTQNSGAVMAYVLFYDIVGSSKLPTDEGLAISSRLQELVRHLPQFEKRLADGTLIIIPTGDGAALVFLGSMEDPAECAVAMAQALQRDPFCKIRTGMHAGPVFIVRDLNNNSNVSGAGINRCERVMSSGDAGHIMISDSFAESLRQFSKWRDKIHDIGYCKTKDGRLNLFSLYDGTVGNPEFPAKSERALELKRRQQMKIAAALILALIVAAGAYAYFGMDHRQMRSLKYSILVKAPNAEPRTVAHEMIFPPGYRLKLQVASPNAGRLYILNEGPPDSSGARLWTWLYPVGKPAVGQLLPANTRITIPEPAEAWIAVDAIRGQEGVYFIWAQEPVEALSGVFDSLDGHGAVPASKVPAIRDFIDRNRDSGQIVNGGAETEIRGRSSVIVARIALEHL